MTVISNITLMFLQPMLMLLIPSQPSIDLSQLDMLGVDLAALEACLEDACTEYAYCATAPDTACASAPSYCDVCLDEARGLRGGARTRRPSRGAALLPSDGTHHKKLR